MILGLHVLGSVFDSLGVSVLVLPSTLYRDLSQSTYHQQAHKKATQTACYIVHIVILPILMLSLLGHWILEHYILEPVTYGAIQHQRFSPKFRMNYL